MLTGLLIGLCIADVVVGVGEFVKDRPQSHLSRVTAPIGQGIAMVDIRSEEHYEFVLFYQSIPLSSSIY